jgi:hypothetical protein
MYETEPCRKKENMGKWEKDREEFKDHAGQEEVSQSIAGRQSEK